MIAPKTNLPRVPKLIDLITLICSVLAIAVSYSEFFLRGADPVHFLPTVLGTIGVLLSRQFLWSGFLATVAAQVLAAVLGTEPILMWTVTVFVVLSVSLRALPVIPVALVAAAGSYAASVATDGALFQTPFAITSVSVVLAAAGAGSALRSYYRYRDERDQRIRDASIKRIAEANRRIADERIRIAQDLHDLVGHEIAMLGIHLGVAEVNLPPEASTAKESLSSARVNVQSILSETQRILHVLRTTDGSSAQSGLPTPSLGGLEYLVQTVTSAGMKVNAVLCPVPDRLDPEVSTAAYRIVQEALTNAQRHGVGTVELSTEIDAASLVITVLNRKTTTPTADTSGSGFGLVGMRERTESAGGHLLVEDSKNTFQLTATLPVHGGTD